MHSEMQRFTNRFQSLFADKGLTNVKFFVRDAESCSLETFMKEANGIQDTIAAGEVEVVGNVDEGCRKKRFNEPF